MRDPALANRRLRVGGPEVLTFRQLAALIGRVLGRQVGTSLTLRQLLRCWTCIALLSCCTVLAAALTRCYLRAAALSLRPASPSCAATAPSRAPPQQIQCKALPVLPARAAAAAMRVVARATQSRRLLGAYRFLSFVLLVSLDRTVSSRQQAAGRQLAGRGCEDAPRMIGSAAPALGWMHAAKACKTAAALSPRTPASLTLPLVQEQSLVGQAVGEDRVEAYLRQRAAQLAASQQQGEQAASDVGGAPVAS